MMKTNTESMASYTAHNYGYSYQAETAEIAGSLKPGVVATRSHNLGMNKAEPIIVILDALIRYAKAYNAKFEGKLATDSVLGDYWLDAITATRKLLSGDGAVAMEMDVTTDSKDNGACEAMFWQALEIAGFEEKDLQ